MVKVIENLDSGRVLRGTAEFAILEKHAESNLAQIFGEPSKKGFLARLGRTMLFNALNTDLRYYGWAVSRDGEMAEVAVHDRAGPDRSEKSAVDPFSQEGMAERIRSYASGSGYVVDPVTGRRMDKRERYRYGVS